MRYEKVQKGNPHELTVKQHIFPARSILRFCAGDGLVPVRNIVTGDLRLCRPSDEIFCGRRVWSHFAEAGYMKDIETAFQVLAEQIIAGTANAIIGEDARIVTAFYSLWRVREHFLNRRMPDVSLNGMPHPERTLTKDQEERLEKVNVLFTRGHVMPSRLVTGVSIRLAVDRMASELEGEGWGVLRSDRYEFMVPNTYGDYTAVPVSPRILLAKGVVSADCRKQQVRQINQVALRSATRYIFAQTFKSCPT